MKKKPIVWTLDEARSVVKRLQSRLWAVGWHVALGGGVLNNGDSHNDLDLYVLPFGSEHGPVSEALNVLQYIMDYEAPIGNDVRYMPPTSLECRDRYSYKGKRVDVFVVKG